MIKEWFTTPRVTGFLYLGLAVSGVVGFILPQQLYIADDGNRTLANIMDHQWIARIGLVGQLCVVLFQALTAVWFFKLFRRVHSLAAGALAAFGMINAIGVLVGLMFASQAVNIALDVVSVTGGGQTAAIQMMWGLHESAWAVTSLFFGLWLIPMGYLALLTSMPSALGRILVLGGIGYMLTAFLALAAPGLPSTITEIPAYLATVGEFWIIGYLLRGKFNSNDVSL